MHQIRYHFRYGRANDPRNMFMESPQFLHRLSVASRTFFQDWSQDRGDPSRPEPLLESDRLDMAAQHVGRWGCGDKGEQFTFNEICGIGEPLLAFPSPLALPIQCLYPEPVIFLVVEYQGSLKSFTH